MRKLIRKFFREVTEKDGTLVSADNLTPQDSIDALYQRMFERDIYLHISEVSVVMVGVCLTGVSILNIDDGDTYVDDLLAIDSLVFLVSYLLSYWIVRVTTKSSRNVKKFGSIANTIFLIGMILMVIVCVNIVIQGDFYPGVPAKEQA
jgi:uncharacterized membrane protein